MLNHFRVINDSWDQSNPADRLCVLRMGQFSQKSGKKQLLIAQLDNVYHSFTAFATTFTNSRMSSSVVSNEHIQRTIDSYSIHM